MQYTRPSMVLTRERLEEVVTAYKRFDAFAFDTETMGGRPSRDPKRDIPPLDPMTNDVRWIALAGPGRTDVIPMGHTQPGPKQLMRAEVFEALDPLFHSGALKIGQNLRFDLLSVAKYSAHGVAPPPYMDTLVLVFLLNENLDKAGGYNLENLAKTYLHYAYREKIGKNWWKYPFNRVAQYVALDARSTWMLYWRLIGRYSKPGRERLAELLSLEMDVFEVLMAMYQAGAYVDKADLEAMVPVLTEQYNEVAEEIYTKIGRRINLNSAPQKRELLFKQLKLRGSLLTPGGEMSTNKKVLATLARKNPVVADLQRYADVNKLLTTYVLGYIPHIDDDGRIRANYNQAVAKTGRYSCSSPNLQNVPTRSNDSYESQIIRSVFKAPPGRILVVGDYNQIELRVLSHQCKDPTLLRAYREGLDLHALTASRVYGVPEAEVTKDQRFVGKTSNFNFAFEGGPARVMEVAGVSKAEAEMVYDAWHKAYPYVKRWGTKVKHFCWEHGYVETLYGRKRRLPGIRSHIPKDRAFAERQAVNHPIQGSAADIAKIAMVRLHEQLRKIDAQLVMQVHDEYVVECAEELGDEVVRIVKDTMESIEVLSVPLVADVHLGKTWAEAK